MFQQPTEPVRVRQRSRRLIIGLAFVAVLVVASALITVFSLRDRSAESAAAEGTASSAVVCDLVTNRTLTSENADMRFRSASLVKLLIGIDLVQRGIVTAQRPSPRMTRMLASSDDALAQELWASGGGRDIVTRTAGTLGLHATEPPATATRWGDTLTTANDVVIVYRAILAMPAAKRRLLLDPLRSAPRIAADGTDQHFGIPSGLSGRPWAIKQGWATGRGGVDAHTSGLVGANDRYVVVVLTHQPEGASLSAAEQTVTAKAAALAPLLS